MRNMFQSYDNLLSCKMSIRWATVTSQLIERVLARCRWSVALEEASSANKTEKLLRDLCVELILSESLCLDGHWAYAMVCRSAQERERERGWGVDAPYAPSPLTTSW